ncbi:MAG: endonuclease MutS2 [Spirochaetota bacterium]|jgi:DNA mismatch repair protein MutS2|nr:endonuclease MutS2 [Spirochaetota bacterium]
MTDTSALSVLGFDEITRKLIGYARTPGAKEKLGQAYFPGLAELELLLDETEAALALGRAFGWPVFSEHDIEPLFAQLHPRDAMLSARDLLTIALWLENIAACLQYRKQAGVALRSPESEWVLRQAERLDPWFEGIIPQVPITRAIHNAIDEKGEVLDSASPELARTRHEMRDLAARAMRALQRFLAEPRHEEIIQERIISLRDGRHVIPIKANFAGRVRGIILDRSASGGTLFMEPDAVIPIDNAIKELELKEERLIAEILRGLTSRVQEALPGLSRAYQNTVILDCIFARARLADAHKAVRPEFSPAEDALDIREARHPLLSHEVVPIDIHLAHRSRVLVITGPNTGGKTVALKTLGLFTLMAKCGLFIPAASAALRFFSRVFCDIGDEQSIEKNLSTYSAHIRTVVRILEEADRDSLVLIDEIGAGTDPREGAALAISIIEEAIYREITLVATTHYGAIKNFAYTHEFVDVAGVAFNEETLTPGYRLEHGVPGASHAFSIAARLGLAPDILERARAGLSDEVRVTEEMFRRIENDLAGARGKKLAADEEFAASKAAHAQYKRQVEILKNERQALMEETRLAMRALIEQAKEECARILDQLALREHAPNARETAALHAGIHALEQSLPNISGEANSESEYDAESDDAAELAVGDRVTVLALKKDGVVSAIKGDEATVAIGSFTTQITKSGLRRIGKGKSASPHRHIAQALRSAPSITLDIRGLRALEAEEKLRAYLDDAGIAGLEIATIIHGKGTGSLREVSHRVLSKHPFVASFGFAHPAAGGEGATEVKLSPAH